MFGKDEGGFARSLRGATHIVKFRDRSDYPELAANELFCLKAAQRCGLEVPPFRLAEDGAALVIDRFDLRPDGSYRGVEHFRVLNARRTEEKHRGSYETAIMKRLADCVDAGDLPAENEKLFTLIALDCAPATATPPEEFRHRVRAGAGRRGWRPVYDLMTTAVYLPQDNMALTLDGTTGWPDARRLRQLGETRMIGTPTRIRNILARIADAMAETMGEIRAYRQEHPEVAEAGERMIRVWEARNKGGAEGSVRGKRGRQG